MGSPAEEQRPDELAENIEYDEVSAAQAAKERQQQRAETIRCAIVLHSLSFT
jgi:hypothetical protein